MIDDEDENHRLSERRQWSDQYDILCPRLPKRKSSINVDQQLE